MDILKIPTDNLYKFLAVSGLVLFLGCGYLAFLYQQNLERELMIYKVESRNIDDSISKLSIDASYSDSASEITHLFYLINNSPEKAQEIIKKRELAAVDLDNKKLERKFLENYKPYLDSKIQSIRKLTGWLWVSAWIGCILSIIGFVCWYVFVQRYMDLKLRREFRKQA